VSRHERLLVDGPGGKIEVFVEEHDNPQGIALIAHPHPLFGGTADNKVVTTLARAFRERGCITMRPNFRGVGGSEPTFAALAAPKASMTTAMPRPKTCWRCTPGRAQDTRRRRRIQACRCP